MVVRVDVPVMVLVPSQPTKSEATYKLNIKKGEINMSKVVLRKDGMYIEADKITLGGDTTVVTGEFIVDENNRVLEIKHD